MKCTTKITTGAPHRGIRHHEHRGTPREALFAPYLPPSLPTTTMTLLPPTTPAVHHTHFSPLFLRLLCRLRGLPAGWEPCVTEAGEVYYQDNYRCLTSWDPPSQGHPREALVPPTTPPPLQPPSSTYHPTYYHLPHYYHLSTVNHCAEGEQQR